RELLFACMEQHNKTVNPGQINDYLISHHVVTDNVRADSNKVDAWRDLWGLKQKVHYRKYILPIFSCL
ncbi:MAG: hypothetical protein IK013_08475, partial [Bacteroidales bacterium]|nr:hypothetical protein [Bacteroidales bacterium]